METYKNVWRCVDVSLFGEHPEYSLIIFTLFLSILPLLFLKETVYKAWQRFAFVAIPLLLFFIFTSPETSGGLFGFTSLFTRESAALNGSILFLVLSYIIIAVQAWRTRKGEKMRV
ncbi:MAG: SoxR reducing system RseC family protein [Candidatus Yonathbacteria bacterium]|nr:SoxR reducing system RseC family protein [Candidatus Yonathbacteria bacterium]